MLLNALRLCPIPETNFPPPARNPSSKSQKKKKIENQIFRLGFLSLNLKIQKQKAQTQ